MASPAELAAQMKTLAAQLRTALHASDEDAAAVLLDLNTMLLDTAEVLRIVGTAAVDKAGERDVALRKVHEETFKAAAFIAMSAGLVLDADYYASRARLSANT